MHWKIFAVIDAIIDDIVLVAGKGQDRRSFTKKIVRKYHFIKSKGDCSKADAERYASVWNGLQAIADGRIGEEMQDRLCIYP